MGCCGGCGGHDKVKTEEQVKSEDKQQVPNQTTGKEKSQNK